MVRTSIILVGSALLFGAFAGAAQEKLGKDRATINGAAEPYEGFRFDQALLRKNPSSPLVYFFDTGFGE